MNNPQATASSSTTKPLVDTTTTAPAGQSNWTVITAIALGALSIVAFGSAACLLTGVLAIATPWIFTTVVASSIAVGCMSIFFTYYTLTMHNQPNAYSVNASISGNAEKETDKSNNNTASVSAASITTSTNANSSKNAFQKKHIKPKNFHIKSTSPSLTSSSSSSSTLSTGATASLKPSTITTSTISSTTTSLSTSTASSSSTTSLHTTATASSSAVTSTNSAAIDSTATATTVSVNDNNNTQTRDIYSKEALEAKINALEEAKIKANEAEIEVNKAQNALKPLKPLDNTVLYYSFVGALLFHNEGKKLGENATELAKVIYAIAELESQSARIKQLRLLAKRSELFMCLEQFLAKFEGSNEEVHPFQKNDVLSLGKELLFLLQKHMPKEHVLQENSLLLNIERYKSSKDLDRNPLINYTSLYGALLYYDTSRTSTPELIQAIKNIVAAAETRKGENVIKLKKALSKAYIDRLLAFLVQFSMSKGVCPFDRQAVLDGGCKILFQVSADNLKVDGFRGADNIESAIRIGSKTLVCRFISDNKVGNWTNETETARLIKYLKLANELKRNDIAKLLLQRTITSNVDFEVVYKAMVKANISANEIAIFAKEFSKEINPDWMNDIFMQCIEGTISPDDLFENYRSQINAETIMKAIEPILNKLSEKVKEIQADPSRIAEVLGDSNKKEIEAIMNIINAANKYGINLDRIKSVVEGFEYAYKAYKMVTNPMGALFGSASSVTSLFSGGKAFGGNNPLSGFLGKF